MATYLPNVNKYVSKTEAFTPDFKFLSDALNRRQDRYDTNYKKMNNLYGSVVHANLSREDNRKMRDTYAEELAPKLQQISGVDFSLDQNVQSAKALFTPFFEDQKIVRDIVFTKRFETEQQRLQGWRNSEDEETRKKYWDEAVQALNYSMKDFQNASREGSMQVQLPEAVEQINLVDIGINKLKELGMDITDVRMSKDGNYQITQRNGSLLTRRAVGKDKDDNIIYTNPAQEYILQTTLDDPRVQRYYQTKFYVKARNFYEKNAEKYGGEDAAKKVFYDQALSDYTTKHSEEIETKDAELSSALQAKNNWEAYKAKHGNPVPGSEEHKKYAQAYNEYLAIANGRKLYDKGHALITAESKGDLKDLEMKATNAFMRYNISDDTRQAAAFYADINSERTVEADKFALANHQSNLNMREAEQDAANQRLQTATEKGWQQVMNPTTGKVEWSPLPWAEGMEGGPADNNYNQIFGGNAGDQTVVAGSGEETMGTYADDDGVRDVISENSATGDQYLQSLRDLRWNSIESYYATKAQDLGDDDNVYSSEGIKVDGKFMNWVDAKEYFTSVENRDKLKAEYDKVYAIYQGHDTGPSLQSDNPELYNKIHKNVKNIEGKSVKLLTGYQKQREVYLDVINLLGADGTLNSVELALMDAYPLFNTRGKIQDPEKIVGKMNTDFTNWYNTALENNEFPKNEAPYDSKIREQHGAMAEKFGFTDVDAMYDRIYTWNTTFGGSRRANATGDKTGRHVDINFIAKKHFNNIYNEWVGQDNAQSLFTKVKNEMNKKMSSAESIPGVQNFNLASFLTNQEQGGAGATLYNYYDSDYISGQVNSKANQQLALINQLLAGPKQNYSIVMGDQSAAYNAVTDPNARLVANEIFANLKVKDPDSYFPKGAAPAMTVRWAEVIGGEGGNGQYGGWIVTLHESYADQLKTSAQSWNNSLVEGIQDNSITIFAPKDMYNPNSVESSYVSTTEFMVDLNGKHLIANDGGKVLFYRNGDNQMMVKESYSTYQKDVNGGSIVPGAYSEPIGPLPASGYLIDKMYERYDNKLSAQIKVNSDASKAHKAEHSQDDNNSQ